MKNVSALYGRLLSALALAGCAVLFAMMLVICLDVLLRNVRIVPGWLGIAWANEATEYALYLITLLVAPWLLRQGQHIRIDVLLRVLPPRLAWFCEWASDLLALTCCIAMAYAANEVTAGSMAKGFTIQKTLTFPEWWLLAPLQVCFALLAIEIVFRMARLWSMGTGLREDAISTG